MVCMYVCSDAYMSVLYGRVCSYLCVVCVHVWYVYVLYVGGIGMYLCVWCECVLCGLLEKNKCLEFSGAQDHAQEPNKELLRMEQAVNTMACIVGGP